MIGSTIRAAEFFPADQWAFDIFQHSRDRRRILEAASGDQTADDGVRIDRAGPGRLNRGGGCHRAGGLGENSFFTSESLLNCPDSFVCHQMSRSAAAPTSRDDIVAIEHRRHLKPADLRRAFRAVSALSPARRGEAMVSFP